MDDFATIDRLRRDQALKRLPDGTEAVAVTLQYKGSMPPLPRGERKDWLQQHFTQLYGSDVQMDPESVSPSGQTVEALCPVTLLGKLKAKSEANDDRLDIVQARQAQLNG